MPPVLLRGSLHWITAAITVAVLLTALPLDALSAIRPKQGQWLNWHIAGGWLLAFATIIRFGRYAIVGDFPRLWRRTASALMFLMLALLAADIAAGILTYRNPPMRAPPSLLGFFEAPIFLRDNHSVHRSATISHRWLSYVLAGVLVLHILAGFRALMRRMKRPLSIVQRR